jgi:hypothetical protein
MGRFSTRDDQVGIRYHPEINWFIEWFGQNDSENEHSNEGVIREN